MTRLLACPFCREIFREDENLELCPECELQLRPLHSLPPSPEDSPQAPCAQAIDRQLPWWHWGGGRGSLTIVALLGLFMFFAPWVHMERPELMTISGFSLARHAAPWLWAGPVGWFISLPLLATRSSFRQLFGVRGISCVFAGMTFVDVVLLAVLPASRSHLVPVSFQFAWGFWLSALLSVIGTGFALRLGATPETDPERRNQLVQGGPPQPPPDDATLH